MAACTFLSHCSQILIVKVVKYLIDLKYTDLQAQEHDLYGGSQGSSSVITGVFVTELIE